jgi:hypothetical protein
MARGQKSQGSLSPYEMLTPFPTECNITSNLSSEKPKSFKPLDSNVLIVTLNNRYQAHLEPLKKTDSHAKMCYRFHLFEFPPLLTLFVSFHPTQGYPFEVFNTHFDKLSTTWIQGAATKSSPSQMHLDFYMPCSSIARTSFVFIIP